MFKKFSIACATFLFLFGCSTTSQLCLQKEAVDSLICPTLAKANLTPESANLIFKLANIEMLRANVYAKADVLKFFDNVESVLNVSTYAQVAQYIIFEIADINSKYAVEFMLITQSVDMFKKIELPISQFDKDMLIEHIKQQRQLLTTVE